MHLKVPFWEEQVNHQADKMEPDPICPCYTYNSKFPILNQKKDRKKVVHMEAQPPGVNKGRTPLLYEMFLLY